MRSIIASTTKIPPAPNPNTIPVKLITALIAIPIASLFAVPIEITPEYPNSWLDRNTPKLKVLRSTEIEPLDSLNEIKRKATHTNLETESLAVQEEKLSDRVARLKRLLQKGYASHPELDSVMLEFQDVSDRIKTQEQFGKFLEGIQSRFTAESFINPPRSEEIEAPTLHLQIPGLSLRAGTLDFFTVRMEPKSETTLEVAKYIESRFNQKIAFPHKNIYGDYFQERLNRTLNIPSALPGELIQSRYYVSRLEKRQLVVNQEFESEWHRGMRIGQFDAFLAKHENGETVRPRTYRGSSTSFWLFGDGEAAPATNTGISAATVAVVERKAQSVHDETRAYSRLQTLQQRYQRIKDLEAKGYSSAVEVREAKNFVDIAALDLKVVQANRMVSKNELDQLRTAMPQSTEMDVVVPLPGQEGGKTDSVDRWLTWLTEGPATDAAEMLRFIDLLEEKFKAEAETGIAKRRVAHASSQLALYRKIPSVLRSELEMKQSVLDQEWADYLEALEVQGTATAKLQQWAQRNFRRSKAQSKASEETLTKVIRAGRKVNRAQAEVVRIEIARCHLKNLYDRDYLNRLRMVQSAGASNNYEVQKARNQVQRSRGIVLSEQKKLQVVDQQLEFLNTLYDSGSISYGKSGMEIARFQPEACQALEKLSVLMDGVDEGKIMQYEADLSDNQALSAELKRLIRHGHGSPVELERANLQRKQIENMLANEQARKDVAEQAVNIVKTLEFVPESPQALDRPVN